MNFICCANASRLPVQEYNFTLSPGVETELRAIWARIATTNPDAATRVIESAYETFLNLAQSPETGRLRKFRDDQLKDVRSWHISGLDNYLIFYRSTPEGIDVLHVCQGAREIEALQLAYDRAHASPKRRMPSSIPSYPLDEPFVTGPTGHEFNGGSLPLSQIYGNGV
jgi:toxin ParE1/3/4